MRRTSKTLLEQMKLSDVEIDRRMELLSLSQKDLDGLAIYKPVIEKNVDDIVERFYLRQTTIDEIALLIGDADTLSRLSNAQRGYIIDLFSGSFDAVYVNNRLRIGMVHKRIGVEPKLYLSAVRTLKKLIVRVLEENINDPKALDKVLDTLDKLFYFDTTLVFDTYIDSLIGEIETAKKRTEDYARSLEEKVAERTEQLEELAKLDPLTNIYNQRAMHEILNRELAQAKRRETVLTLVYFDVDDFKSINDNYGHTKGDEVLKFVAQVMSESIREIDTPCRYGGDEFCIILSECSIENAKSVCTKIIEKFTERYPAFAISMGVAESAPPDYLDRETLIKRADEKMYTAKKQPGSSICS